MVVDPSEKKLLMSELEDLGKGLPGQAEQSQPVTENRLEMVLMMMMTAMMVMMMMTWG